MEFGAKSVHPNTLLLREACRARWPGRHVAGLAQRLPQVKKPTVAAWLSGRCQPPMEAMYLLAGVLRQDSFYFGHIAEELEKAAKLKATQRRRPRGFEIVKDWDGTGIITDRRWRGGRGRRKAKIKGT